MIRWHNNGKASARWFAGNNCVLCTYKSWPIRCKNVPEQP